MDAQSIWMCRHCGRTYESPIKGTSGVGMAHCKARWPKGCSMRKVAGEGMSTSEARRLAVQLGKNRS